VIAGINRGPNLGIDVFYSGTVSGAMEGTILGFPSIAVSVASYKNPEYSFAADFIKKLAPRVLENPNLKDILLNINVPSLPPEQIRGVKITRLGNRKYINSFDARVDPWGRVYYWLGGEVVEEDDTAGTDTDVATIKENKVSITPIQIDLTNYKAMKCLNDVLNDFI